MKQLILDNKDAWTLSCTLTSPVAQLALTQCGRICLRCFMNDGSLVCEVFTYEKDVPLKLSAPVEQYPVQVELDWTAAAVSLYCGGKLMDEEWPVGDCLREGRGWDTFAACVDAEKTVLSPLRDRGTPRDREIGCAQYWSKKPGKINVGDCMPFFDGERYHLYYLKDRHSHESKYGLGAHQFAHLSTADLKSWTEHQMAVEITHPWEGSICTGSILKDKGQWYAFYAVRMSDRTSARLSWATSADGIHFTKSEQYFTLEAPYETTSARDPMVFLGADGQYHMLVTTSLMDSPIRQRSGCLAHLTSQNLLEWRQEGPFLAPGYTDQPECADYFEWNGWYYLLFGNYGSVKYRYSREPFGPWLCPEQELIDGLLYRVPKTAAWHGGRRIAAGFLTAAPEGGSYAGCAVFRELVQAPDGTLSTMFVPEMLPPVSTPVPASIDLRSDAVQAYQWAPLCTMGGSLRLSACITCKAPRASFGFTLRGGCKEYEVRIEPFARRACICRAHENPFATPHYFSIEVRSIGETAEVELIINQDIADLCLDRKHTLIRRLSEPASSWDIGCFVKDGAASFRFME